MEDLNHFVDVWEGSEDSKYLLKYPTVYIINDDKQKGFKVYVGETADIKERTSQHLLTDAKTVPYWADFSLSLTSTMYVIGHRYFNKSLTLDVENRLSIYQVLTALNTSIIREQTNKTIIIQLIN